MTEDEIDRLVRRALAAGNFFVRRGGRIALETRPTEAVLWELFEGQLLDESMARQQKELASWVLTVETPEREQAEGVLTVRHDAAADSLYVTREILSYAHEPYSEQENVILTREVQRNRPELVGTVDLKAEALAASPESVEYELGEYLRLALVGVSRLPITSVESPHPLFSFGWLGYPGRGASDEAESDPAVLVRRALGNEMPAEKRAALLEMALRAAEADEVAALAEAVEARACDGDAVMATVRAMFHGLALSPYTPLVDRLMAWLRRLAAGERVGRERVVDVVGFMLRQLVRHVTAFDLETFHNFGANYPDALFLEELLEYLWESVEAAPELFAPQTTYAEAPPAVRLRRRALRQAMVARQELEGLRVPDAPTSPGELVRVMPKEWRRIPAEQVSERGARKRRLFAERPTAAMLEELLGTENAQAVWRAAIADLRDARELRELGTATFLDRPLGRLQGGGANRTPLVSYVATSRGTGTRRLRAIGRAGWLPEGETAQSLVEQRDATPPPSFAARNVALPVLERLQEALDSFSPAAKGAVISLEDALQVSLDFQFHRTTAGSLGRLWAGYDFAPLATADAEFAAWLLSDAEKLVVPHFALVDGDKPSPFPELDEIVELMSHVPTSGDPKQSQDIFTRLNQMATKVGGNWVESLWRLRVLDAAHAPRCQIACGEVTGESPPVDYAGVEYLRGGLQIQIADGPTVNCPWRGRTTPA